MFSISYGIIKIAMFLLRFSIVVLAGSVDQDQAEQNVQPDPRSMLSAMLELGSKKMAWSLLFFALL